MAALIHRSGSQKGRRERLGRETTKLGRKADNDIVFSENVVSSHHAEIRHSRDTFAIIDLDSTNGTFVNEKRIDRTRLRDGDRIEIGEGGPLLEFKSDEKSSERGPFIVPMSGSWDSMDPIGLECGTLTIGRSQENDIVLGRTHGSVVSSRHAEIRVHADSCEIEDLNSVNGILINDRKVRHALLNHGDRVELGEGGPVFEFRWKERGRHSRRGNGKGDEKMLRKLDRAARGGPAGDYTRVMLAMAQKYHKHHSKPYVFVSIIVIVIAAAALGTSIWYYQRTKQLRDTIKAFYDARELRVELSAKASASEQEKQNLREKRRKLEEEYDKYLEKAGWYDKKTPEQRAVLKMVRRLGETELDMPEGFYETIMQYIAMQKRQSTLRNALQRARSRNLLPMIRDMLATQDLPPEFLFIAYQESGFDYRAVGPPTRIKVFAKGMWQLIPATARQYGLTTGPDENNPVFDASDQRHDEVRSTQAATHFLAELYNTKAQASGLLVMASYNYGPYRIEKNLDDLPNDPRVRSFWYFYRHQWIPEQTRDYVLKILSAALIYENPDLFGYDLGSTSSGQ